jgi:hypothetical protein
MAYDGCETQADVAIPYAYKMPCRNSQRQYSQCHQKISHYLYQIVFLMAMSVETKVPVYPG